MPFLDIGLEEINAYTSFSVNRYWRLRDFCSVLTCSTDKEGQQQYPVLIFRMILQTMPLKFLEKLESVLVSVVQTIWYVNYTHNITKLFGTQC